MFSTLLTCFISCSSSLHFTLFELLLFDVSNGVCLSFCFSLFFFLLFFFVPVRSSGFSYMIIGHFFLLNVFLSHILRHSVMNKSSFVALLCFVSFFFCFFFSLSVVHPFLQYREVIMKILIDLLMNEIVDDRKTLTTHLDGFD